MFAFLSYDDYHGRNCVTLILYMCVYILTLYLYQLGICKWMMSETQMVDNKL